MDELFARVRESLEKMDRRDAEKKRRREALQEKRWRERCKKRSNGGDTKSPLFPTWASAGALSSGKLLDEEEVESSEPLEADAVGSSSCCMAKDTTSDEEDSSPEPPYISKYAYLDDLPKPPPPEPVPEEELIRRRKVEQELIALSKKITEEKLRQERMIPFVPAKPTFDPFSSSDTSTTAAADSSDGDSSSKEPQNPNPRKRPYSNLTAIGVPPQASAYYAQSSYGPGGYMGGCYRQYSEEEVNDFVAFVDKWIPTDPKWKKKKPSTESSTDDDKKSSKSSTDDDKETVCNKEE